jgi:phosphatidylglycerophosphate synthase
MAPGKLIDRLAFRGGRAPIVDTLLTLAGAGLLLAGEPWSLLILATGLMLLVAAVRPAWLRSAEEVTPRQRRRRATVWVAVGLTYLGLAAVIFMVHAPGRPLLPWVLWAVVQAVVGSTALMVAYEFARPRGHPDRSNR